MSKCPSGVVCSARNCDNNAYNSNLTFFNFPKDPIRAQIWLSVCGREDLMGKINNLSSYRICAAHFELRMYTNNLKNCLLSTSIPTIFSSLKYLRPTISNEHNYLTGNKAAGSTWVTLAEYEEASNLPVAKPSTMPLRTPLVSPGSTLMESRLTSTSPRKRKRLSNENYHLQNKYQKLQ